MKRGDSVIENSSGDVYIVYASTNTEICILQFFDYAYKPKRRQLLIWQEKSNFTLHSEKDKVKVSRVE